jgi:hypothetical protein
VNKPRRIKWVKHIASMKVLLCLYNLVGKYKGKDVDGKKLKMENK